MGHLSLHPTYFSSNLRMLLMPLELEHGVTKYQKLIILIAS